MEAEHCQMTGSDLEFTTPNYRLKTCPKDEWRLLALRRGQTMEAFLAKCRSEQLAVGLGEGHHGRRIPDVDKLLRLESSKEAGLQVVEVIMVVLYTGPMVGARPLPQAPPRGALTALVALTPASGLGSDRTL